MQCVKAVRTHVQSSAPSSSSFLPCRRPVVVADHGTLDADATGGDEFRAELGKLLVSGCVIREESPLVVLVAADRWIEHGNGSLDGEGRKEGSRQDSEQQTSAVYSMNR